MKVTHKLSDKYTKEVDDRNLSIFMLSKLGNYFSLSANPDVAVSNYCGYFHNMSGSMFKSIDNIYLTGDEGKKNIPYEIVNNFNDMERLYEGHYERFTLVKNGLIYDIETENANMEMDLDFRWVHDYDDRGREYKIHRVDDSLIVEYIKYVDNSLKEKSHTKYMIISGIQESYENPADWIKKTYSYDAGRNSRAEFYVYHALKVPLKGKCRLIITFSEDKRDAMEKLMDIKKNMKMIDDIQTSYSDNHLSLKYNLSQTTGKETAFGYVNAVHAIDGLMIHSNDMYGLWAGLPWFFQYWSRDEIISLRSLMLEGKKEFVKDVLTRHINAIQSNGRLPNMYTSSQVSGLGSADSIGWLFRRIKDVFLMAETTETGDGEKENYFNLYEIKYIRERLQFAIKQLLSNHYIDGLIHNDALETWMDTSCANDEREGFRIEIQAAFLCMLNVMNMLNHLLANKFVKKNRKLIDVTKSDVDYKKLERDTAKLVRERFFVNGYLNDGWNSSNPDVARPNVFLAYYLYPELLKQKEWEKVFDNLIPRIWVEWDIDGKSMGGFSTIDKENNLYQPNYTGQDNRSYHRGDLWFWVDNVAAISMHRLNKDKYYPYIKKILDSSTEDMLFRGYIGYASELSSSSHLDSGGCFCQTWSIGTYIELIHEMFIE